MLPAAAKGIPMLFIITPKRTGGSVWAPPKSADGSAILPRAVQHARRGQRGGASAAGPARRGQRGVLRSLNVLTPFPVVQRKRRRLEIGRQFPV